MNVDQKITGGCLCGDTKYTGIGEPKWVVHCHCKLCQRHSGAAFLTYVGFSYEDLVWEQQPPSVAGTLDDPDQITPTAHAFWDHHFSWLDINDDNPRYARHPAGNEDRDT
jgi:hypothetical protein